MGKFACHCGYIISDSVYPCPFSGELRWENETDFISDKTTTDVKDFLSASENGNREEWIKNYFGEIYPLDLESAEIIDDIYSKVANEKGHSVLQCSECHRIYIQKEFYSDDWICYEKKLDGLLS